MGLLVDLVRINPDREDERRVHEPAPLLREERAAEVHETVQEEEDGVLVPVCVPSAGRDHVRVVEPRAGLCEPDHSAQHAARRVGGEGDDEMTDEPIAGRHPVEGREPV